MKHYFTQSVSFLWVSRTYIQEIQVHSGTFSVYNHDTKCPKFGSFKGTTEPTLHINPFAENK